MKTNKIKYKSGYKYQLNEGYIFELDFISHGIFYKNDYIELIGNMVLVSKGYAWDGPSGPTFDTKSFMRGSLEHDVLYQLMRENAIHGKYRKNIDLLLIKTCKEDGMSWIRRKYVYYGLRIGAGCAANPKNTKKVKIAP